MRFRPFLVAGLTICALVSGCRFFGPHRDIRRTAQAIFDQDVVKTQKYFNKFESIEYKKPHEETALLLLYLDQEEGNAVLPAVYNAVIGHSKLDILYGKAQHLFNLARSASEMMEYHIENNNRDRAVLYFDFTLRALKRAAIEDEMRPDFYQKIGEVYKQWGMQDYAEMHFEKAKLVKNILENKTRTRDNP
tara:strand:- start:1046 stop:1618 length:573 start_codon:yes stop_codon:yes gene_type:complete